MGNYGGSCVRSMIGETFGDAFSGFGIDPDNAADVALAVGALVYDGLVEVANGLGHVADAVHRLGNGNASTEFGAIEAFSMQLSDSLNLIASALDRDERTALV